MRDLLEAIGLADQVALDVHGAGEHHRSDFVRAAGLMPGGAFAFG